MTKRLAALWVAIFMTIVAALPVNPFSVAAAGSTGSWNLINTVDYVNKSTTYLDGAALLYSMSGNSITYTYRNNIKQDFIGTCSWSQPAASIAPGQKITVSLNASVDKLDPNRAGTFSASVFAYLDEAEVQYKLQSGSAVYLKDESGETTCKAMGKDGVIVTGSASLTVGADMPDGSNGQQLALMISSSIGGGKKFVYEYSVAADVTEPTTPPVPDGDKKLVLTGTVISVAQNPMRHMYMRFAPSFGGVAESKTGNDGKYRYMIDIPSSVTSPFTVDVTLVLKYMHPSSTDMSSFYFAIRDETEKAGEDILVTTKISIDPDSAQFRGKNVLEANRNIDFTLISSGMISDSNGKGDPLTSNLTEIKWIDGYTYVYDMLSSAVYTACEVFAEKTATVNSFPLIVYVNEPVKDGKDSACFGVEGGMSVIHATLDYCRHTDQSRFVILHEFGHFFDYATNLRKHRCNWDVKMLAADYINHGGYLNSDTGDSYMEGLATWFAVMVQKHGLYPIPNYTSIGSLGTLGSKRKPWHTVISEELCIASILVYLERDLSLDGLWEVLQRDNDNFHAYYQDLVKTFNEERELSKINRYFKAFGMYKHIYGNSQWDEWELYRDIDEDGARGTDEMYADTMFNRYGELLTRLGKQEALKILGQSAPYNRQDRDALPAAKTIYQLPNSYLMIKGTTMPDYVRVAVMPDDADAYAYVGVPEGSLVYLPLPEEAATGTVEVTIPGGGVLFSGSLAKLQTTFWQTARRTAYLDEAVLTSDMLPAGDVFVCPVDGDAYANPYYFPDQVFSNESPVFATSGAMTETGQPIRTFSVDGFVLTELDEQWNDDFAGGNRYKVEKGLFGGLSPSLVIFAIVVIAVFTGVIVAFFRRRR